MNRGRNRVVLIYTVVSFIVSTIFMAASSKFVEVVLIESAVDPVGSAKLMPRLDLLQQVVYSMKIWLADSLLVRVLLMAARCHLNPPNRSIGYGSYGQECSQSS
jgi:uncharacterized membrane protein YbhN (UPF0104 family)